MTEPDIDNALKSIFDGCNNVVFKDDTQIVTVHATKFYAENAATIVLIERL